MRILFVIAAGPLLLAVFMLFGKPWGGDLAGIAVAATLLVPAWLVVALVDAPRPEPSS